jgi:chromosome segregation ATPase
VPTATLLEPNNFIPSWEAGDEEKKEVSQTLRKLRIKYDNINKLVREKERELEELKKKLEQKGDEEYKVEDALYKKSNNILSAEDELAQIRDEHDFELMFQRTYYHMIERMKRDLIALQIEANDMHDSHK